MRTTLRRGLTAALRDRDRIAISALRSALAAIDNAEAVPADHAEATSVDGEHVAGAAVGNGAADVSRRQLSEPEVLAIVEREMRERSTAASEYEQLGRHDQAQRLRAEADVLSSHLSGTS